MTSADPLAPLDWRDLASEYRSAGPDSRWQDNAIRLLRKHGAAALVVADVQDLVRLATGTSASSILSEQRLARIPESEWALAEVWKDRETAGCLWAATEDLRSIDAELGVLACLCANGFVPVKEATREGRDWTLLKEGRVYSIEVKAKGEQNAKLDYVHRAYVGQQLVDQSGLLRSCRVNYYLMNNAMDRARSSNLHWLAMVMASVAPLIAERMPQTWQEANLDVDGGRAVLHAHPRGWRLRLKNADGWCVDMTATMDSTPWRHNYLRPHAGHVIRRLSRDRQEEVARMLSTLVCSNEAQFKKSNSLYVVLWPAPLTWDDTLADTEEVVDGILEAMTRELEEKKGSLVPIALWGESFGRFGGRMRLNGSAEELLGAKTLATRTSS